MKNKKLLFLNSSENYYLQTVDEKEELEKKCSRNYTLQCVVINSISFVHNKHLLEKSIYGCLARFRSLFTQLGNVFPEFFSHASLYFVRHFFSFFKSFAFCAFHSNHKFSKYKKVP